MQSKARELSEECIQHTLDRTEVQMREALIMQAEHNGCTSQSERFGKRSTNQSALAICPPTDLVRLINL